MKKLIFPLILFCLFCTSCQQYNEQEPLKPELTNTQDFEGKYDGHLYFKSHGPHHTISSTDWQEPINWDYEFATTFKVKENQSHYTIYYTDSAGVSQIFKNHIQVDKSGRFSDSIPMGTLFDYTLVSFRNDSLKADQFYVKGKEGGSSMLRIAATRSEADNCHSSDISGKPK